MASQLTTPSERTMEAAAKIEKQFAVGGLAESWRLRTLIANALRAEREEQRERDAQKLDKLAEVFDDQSRELECDAVMNAAATLRNQKEGQQ